MACQNLLAQMLLPSPEQRITVAEILRHPWFLRDLPPGTELVNERLQHDVHARQAIRHASSRSAVYLQPAIYDCCHCCQLM
jgi:serine/threonine protein kinase